MATKLAQTVIKVNGEISKIIYLSTLTDYRKNILLISLWKQVHKKWYNQYIFITTYIKADGARLT